MENLFAELSNVSELCLNDIRELEEFFGNLSETKKCTCGLREKGKIVSQKKAVHLNQSEENSGLDWSVEPSLRQQHGGGEQLAELAEKLSETQSELKQAKEIIKTLENATLRKTQGELEDSRSQITRVSDKLSLVELELKQSKERIEHLEYESEVEKSTLQKTKEELERAKLQIKIEEEKSSQSNNRVSQIKEMLVALETDYHMEKSAHQKTKEELEKAKLHNKMNNDENIPIHIQLRESREIIRCLEADFHAEKSKHEKTREVLHSIKAQNRAHSKKNIQSQIDMKQLKEKIEHLENNLCTEKSAHLKTREVLEAIKSDSRVTEISVSKKTLGKERPYYLDTTVEELHAQLQQAISEKSCLEEIYEREKAAHQDTKEELEEAKAQIKVLNDKCKGRRMEDASVVRLEHKVRHLQAKEDDLKDHMMHQQNNLKRLREDLLSCTSVIGDPMQLQEAIIALKARYFSNADDANESDILEKKYQCEMSDLRTKIENCTALLEASLNAKVSLEEKLSNVDTVYAEREEEYVRLINMYIVEGHNFKTKLNNHISKCKKPVPMKVRSWIKKKILQMPSEKPHDIEEPLHLYPDDWRLPGNPKQWGKEK